MANDPTFLDRIVAAKKVALQRRMAEEPQAALRERAALLPRERRSLRNALSGETGAVRLIAEVKMASPSAGRLIDDKRRRVLPALYAENGAAAISVLTEADHFQGSLHHLAEARAALKRYQPRPAVLRKDFLFHPYQIVESFVCGADALLLIVAILSDSQLSELLALSHEMGMDCLVETHNEAEVKRAVRAGARIIGINNRDLRTFKVDLAVTERLLPLVPSGTVVVSESGIRDHADVERLARAGVHAVLVGESLLRANDVAAKLRELLL